MWRQLLERLHPVPCAFAFKLQYLLFAVWHGGHPIFPANKTNAQHSQCLATTMKAL